MRYLLTKSNQIKDLETGVVVATVPDPLFREQLLASGCVRRHADSLPPRATPMDLIAEVNGSRRRDARFGRTH